MGFPINTNQDMIEELLDVYGGNSAMVIQDMVERLGSDAGSDNESDGVEHSVHDEADDINDDQDEDYAPQ